MREYTSFHEAIGAPLHFPAPLILASEGIAQGDESAHDVILKEVTCE
jgi:hypothetical protein